MRILVADESKQHLEPVGDAVRELGHEVIALEVEPGETARATHEHQPDLAIVALHEDKEHALELIREIVDEATCPVCLLAGDPSREFLSAAARHGVFAHLDSTDPTELGGGIDIAIQRFRQFRDLLGAFERRARIERAKGVLMERHGISADEAFARLRRQARDTRAPIMRVVDEVLG
ncbi:MAG TPA: ANTAR domain-containing protein [Solirubrobacteraceae bacterium]|nr:ANTAR domain-containing protein [Solirubrobacteraceae bacterium]